MKAIRTDNNLFYIETADTCYVFAIVNGFAEHLYYGALDASRVRDLLTDNGFEILTFTENYSEPTTGTRDLLVTARKTK